jgi:hypothetical protein
VDVFQVVTGFSEAIQHYDAHTAGITADFKSSEAVLLKVGNKASDVASAISVELPRQMLNTDSSPPALKSAKAAAISIGSRFTSKPNWESPAIFRGLFVINRTEKMPKCCRTFATRE